MTIEELKKIAHREGVTHEDNLPFLFEPSSDLRGGILMVHGFTGTPWEMRPFGRALAKEGFLTLGIRLPGHGTTPDDLSKRDWKEWLHAVEEGYNILSERTGQIFGIGQSTGALLLLQNAATRPPTGLVLLSPYLRIRHFLAPAAGWLRFFKEHHQHRKIGEETPHYYDRRPLHGVHQINLLVRKVRKVLGNITIPVLAISGDGDRTVCVESALRLFRRLGSSRKEYHLLGPEVPHVLTTAVNPKRKEVLQLTLDFLQSLEAEKKGL